MGIQIWLWVAFGGALGAIGRFGVTRASVHYLGNNFPWGTLAANVSGSVAMGFAIIWLSRHEPANSSLRAFLAVGLLGAFTTFSTFALDAVMLFRDRSELIAIAYVTASMALSIGGILAGIFVGRQVL